MASIFFAHSKKSGCVLMGYSSFPDAAITSVSDQHPEYLRRLGLIPCSEETFFGWERRFHAEHIKGGWYVGSMRLRAAIRYAVKKYRSS